AVRSGCTKIQKELAEGLAVVDLSARAKFLSDRVTGLIEEVRTSADAIEEIVPDELWSLPKYSEMLFIM
ncbi:MAG TPA: hypothetical protein VGB38_09270, partial [bacterium]